jgi:hypothetical protein
MNQTAAGLVEQCRKAALDGAEFPVIWEHILRTHSLVASPPVRTFEDELSHLDVRLSNGYWLRYCVRSNDFSLRRANLHRAF